MAKPTTAQIRAIANPLLSEMLVAFMNDDTDFAARQVAPVVPVDEQSGTYYTIPSKYQYADQLERRAYGDTFPQSGYEFGTDTYVTLQWGLEHPIPDEDAASFQARASLQQVALQWLAGQSNIRKENQFASDFMAASVWDNEDLNSTQDWDTASGVPITDIQTAKRTVNQAGGRTPNAMLCGEIVYDALLLNAEVEGKLQYTQTMTIAQVESLLAATLGLETIAVSRALENTANLGQTESLSPIIDDDALVLVVEPGADMFTASAVKTFVWEPGGGQGMVRQYYSDERNAEMIQHKEQWDQKLVASSLGYFFQDVV